MPYENGQKNANALIYHHAEFKVSQLSDLDFENLLTGIEISLVQTN